MLAQLERQHLSARLAGARQLLADSSVADDPIGHYQYTQLVQELEHEMGAMPQKIANAPAGVALFFGGLPVMGSHGIEADFGSKAIEAFQKLVSQRYASDAYGALPSKGPLPHKEQSQLIMTDVVRGSFGFVLQAPEDAVDSSMGLTVKAAVDKVAETLSRVSAQDETLFDHAAEEIDERQKSALTEFFKLLDSKGATMRVVEGDRDFELRADDVQRARKRVESMTISDRVEALDGYIVGWSDHKGAFDLRPHNGGSVISGNVAAAELERIAHEGTTPLHQHAVVRVKVREVTVRQRPPKKAYTLLSLTLGKAPLGWEQSARQTRIA